MSSDSDSMQAFREKIVEEYKQHPTGCGGSFSEILAFELQCGDQDEFLDFDESIAKNGVVTGCNFTMLAKKWGISVEFLGELILDDCRGWDL